MNNLKAARKVAHMTQAEVAKVIGITQNGYSYWETGKAKIDHESLSKLADLFGVTTDYLIGASENPKNTSILIPVLGSIPAGIPLEAIEDVIDNEEIPATMGAGGKKYFALEVKGDSMYPEFLPGDRVIVLLTDVCSSGDVCVVRVNGYEATLKRVRVGADRSLTLEPRNPEYPPRTYTPEEIENLPVSIAGVVVELRRKVK